MASQQRRKEQKKKSRQKRIKQKRYYENKLSFAPKSNGPMIEVLRPTGFGMPNMSTELSLFLTSKLLEKQDLETIEDTSSYLNAIVGKAPEELADLAEIELDPRTHAQYLAYQGYLAEDDVEADRLINQALELDPECTDALLYQVKTTFSDINELEKASVDELLQAIEASPQRLLRLVEIAEKRLGPDYFSEWHGEFWNVPSRPYMRVLREYGKASCAHGELEQARAVFEKMLDLNPNDNQGVRDSLLCLYLEQGDAAAARELFIRYPQDPGAVFCFARVLERWLSRDFISAIRLLKEARREHPFVEECLFDPEALPDELPEYYSHGDWEEAVYCATIQMDAWVAHPTSLDWLEEQLSRLDG